MADLKITALPVDTVMSNDDLMVKVDDPAGLGAATKKISWLNLSLAMMNTMGYSVVLGDIVDIKADIVDLEAEDIALAGDIATIQGDIVTIQIDIAAIIASLNSLEYGEIFVHDGVGLQTMSSGAYTKLTQFNQDGLNSTNVAPSHATDSVTIARTGIYEVSYHMSFTGTNNVTWELVAFNDGVEQIGTECTIKIGTGTDTVACQGRGLIEVDSVPHIVDLRAQPNGVTKSITLVNGSLCVTRLGPI